MIESTNSKKIMLTTAAVAAAAVGTMTIAQQSVSADDTPASSWQVNSIEDVKASVNAEGTDYTVQYGDTVSVIAQATGLSVEDIVNTNQLSSADWVIAGQKLNLASGAIAPSSSAAVSETVATSQATTTESVTSSATTASSSVASSATAASQAAQSAANASSAAASQAAQSVANASSAAASSAAASQAAQSAANASSAAASSAVVSSQVVQSSVASQTTSMTSSSSSATITSTAPASETAASATSSVSGSWSSVAMSLVGTPYVWGGKTPATGFDCAGFVSYVYNHSGMTTNFPSYTVAEENNVNIISPSQAQPGDLLFWGSRGASYHVAIYLGGNQYIAAPKPGDHVKVGTLTSSWYPTFAGTLR